jgi:RNA polymerase sigma-70 factor (ECF subfamily)
LVGRWTRVRLSRVRRPSARRSTDLAGARPNKPSCARAVGDADDQRPASWLATIAKRVAIDIYRREARRPAGSLDDAAPDDTALVTLPPELDTLDAVWRVRRAIDALPSDESVIVRMQHLEGMTHSEISEQLEIPLGTVKSRSSRAHRKLASLLGHLRESVA